MNRLLFSILLVACCASHTQAQDDRNRYGDSLKFVYIRGHEEGPDLEGEFGAFEDCFGFAGYMGGTFIPVKYKMEAKGSNRFTDNITLLLKCYYTPPFHIAIADNKGKIVAEGKPQKSDTYEYTFSIGSQPPGMYMLNFYTRKDSLVQSIPFRKPDFNKR